VDLSGNKIMGVWGPYRIRVPNKGKELALI